MEGQRTTSVLDRASEPAAVAEAGPRPWRHRAVAAAIMALGVLAAAAVLVANLPEPDSDLAFSTDLGSVGSIRPIPIGTTYPVQLSTGLPDVTVISAEPQVVDGSAAVAAEVVACEPVSPRIVGGDPWDLRTLCERTVALDDLDLSTLSPDAHLMLVVVPLSDGAVEIDGVRIFYRRGNTVQQQMTGVHLTLPA